MAHMLVDLCFEGDVDGVAKSIAAGASLFETDMHGTFPLSASILCGHVSIFKMLIAAGALEGASKEVTLAATEALSSAGMTGNVEILSILLDHPSCQITEFTASIFPSCSQDSPLVASCSHGHVESAKLLLDRGYNIDVRKPLQLGSYGGRASFGPTPLMAAADQGHMDVVKLLLDYNADVTLLTNFDESAAVIAKRKGHKEIAELLIAKGSPAEVSKRPVDEKVKLDKFSALNKDLAKGPSDHVSGVIYAEETK